MEIQQNTMPQNRRGQRANVFISNVKTAMHQRARLARQHQELRGPHAAAKIDVLLDEIGAFAAVRPRGAHQIYRVTGHRFSHRSHAHQLLKAENLFAGGDGISLGAGGGGGQIDNLDLIFRRQIIQNRIKEEPIQLRFGQWISAFQFDGILRGENEKRRFDFVLVTTHRAGQLLHCLKQSGLRFRRRAVDFIGQQNVRKNRTGDERPGAMAGAGIFFDDVGAGDVGRHQIGRELNAVKTKAQRARQRAHQQRLGGAGKTREQTMPSHEQRDENTLDDVFLAYDDLMHLAADLILNILEALDAFAHFGRIHGCCG